MSYLWMVGLVMRLFSCWAKSLKIISMYSAKKGPAPWNLFLTPAPRPLQVTLFGWWSWTYVVVDFFKDTCIFQKKQCFEFWARVDKKFLNLSHHVLSMDGWPGDATFFPWANLWRSSACIQPKKVQPLGIYFWHLRLGLFKSPFLLGKAEHMWLQPFARTNLFSAKNMCFAFWARVQDKCAPLQGQMYLWEFVPDV